MVELGQVVAASEFGEGSSLSAISADEAPANSRAKATCAGLKSVPCHRIGIERHERCRSALV